MNDTALLHFIVLLVARGLDVGTTYLATPDLSGELNAVVRAMGWRYWIASNVLLCLILCPLPIEVVALVATLSVLVGLWNLRPWSRTK